MRFLGGCLRAAEAGALGDLPDASKRHQGPVGGGSVVRGAVMALMLMTVVTWNLQRVSLREQNRGRLRRVAEWVEQRGWEAVLVTELFGEGEGVSWMMENERRYGFSVR